MAGFKTFLKLGELPDGSLDGLLRSGYEIEHCSYAFAQGIDEKGAIQTRVHGGTIALSLRQLPTDELIKWAFSSEQSESGVIILYDENDMPLEKTFFKKAKCIHMKINYETDGKAYTCTDLVLSAESITLGTGRLGNDWTF